MTELNNTPELDRDIDPDRIGRRRFLQGVGAVAGAGAVASALPAGLADAASTGTSVFKPLAKAVRVVDTREPGKYVFTRLAPNRLRLHLADKHGIPAGAKALVATVTGVNWTLPNWIAVFPSGADIPLVSNLNMTPGDVNANLVTVKLGAAAPNVGAIDVYSRKPCDMIVDVIGYYEGVEGKATAGRFVGLSSAKRAIDTRPNLVGSNTTSAVDLTAFVPANASAAVINLTATECTGLGHFTVFPYTEDTVPFASSLNVTRAGETRAAAVIVPISNFGGKRRIKINTRTAAKLIVDVTGYYTGESDDSSTNGLFVPVDPVRVLDTRLPGEMGRLWPRWVVEGKVPGAGATEASAIVVNLTGVDSRAAGFFTISAARQAIPPTSNVNWTGPGAVVPNHAITPITAANGFQVYSSHGAHVVVDYGGYFTGTPKFPTKYAYVNPPPPPSPPPWHLSVHGSGFDLDSWVYEGDPKSITDSGSTWLWTGTGYMGEASGVATFGHRTEGWPISGPYRNLQYLQVGDLFTVTTLDNRQYLYKMVRRDLTDAGNTNILNAARAHHNSTGKATFSMIACTVGYDSSKSRYPDAWAPTSLKYRIVVTGELVSWKEF